MSTTEKWLAAFAQVVDGKSVQCPKCAEATIRYQYVGDLQTRIGYAAVWCSSCNYGLHVSRTEAPEHLELLPFGIPDSELKKRIPDFVWIE